MTSEVFKAIDLTMKNCIKYKQHNNNIYLKVNAWKKKL